MTDYRYCVQAGEHVDPGDHAAADCGWPEPKCLQREDGTCSGAVEYRPSLTGTGTAIPRCAHHWDARLRLEEELNRRYPEQPPDDWSPLDAGEAWGEDDY